MRQRTRHTPRLPPAAATALVVASLTALPAAGLVDLDLVVQMPLAVVEAEDRGYPRADLALLAEGLIAARLAPVEVIDVLRWAPLVWYLDELDDGQLFANVELVEPDRRRLRLIEDRHGVWLVTTRDDLVFVDLADGDVERQWLLDPTPRRQGDRLRTGGDRDPRRDGPGMGAYVQGLLDEGLSGTELAEEIHRELRRRGVPAGPKDRLDGPPPASPAFVVERKPRYMVVDGRRVDLRAASGDEWLPPGHARRMLAQAEPLERRGGPPAAVGRRGEATDDRSAAQRGGPPPEAGPPPGRGRGGGPPAARGRGPAAGRDDRGGGPPPDGVSPPRGGRDDRPGNRAKSRGEGRGADPPTARGRGDRGERGRGNDGAGAAGGRAKGKRDGG